MLLDLWNQVFLRILSKNSWCQHLISAGLKMSPVLFINPKKAKNGTKSLTHLVKYQRQPGGRTGRKIPKANDYKDDILPVTCPELPYKRKKRTITDTEKSSEKNESNSTNLSEYNSTNLSVFVNKQIRDKN